MPALTPKTQLLKEAGYVFHFDREIYFNRNERKVFTMEYVEDHTLAELQKKIAEKRKKQAWSFYFSGGPAPLEIRRELENLLK